MEAPTPIPTWKILLGFAPCVVLLWIAAAIISKHKPATTPEGTFVFGLAFFSVGVWCGVCGVVWHRLSPGFHTWWRPNSVVTPFLLAVIFGCVGAWQAIAGLTQLLGG